MMLPQALTTGMHQQSPKQLHPFQPDCPAPQACKGLTSMCQHQTAFAGQGSLSQAGNAEAPVIAFAAAVAQQLLLHIAQHVPAEVSSALSHQLKQQVTLAAAEAAAAGRPFNSTAVLQHLLPQLSVLASQVSHHSSMLAAAAAAAAMPAASSTGGAGQLTRFNLSPQLHNPRSQQHQQQHCGGPLRDSRDESAHVSTALMSSGCADLPSLLAGMHSLLQQQQGAWSAQLVPSAVEAPWAAVDAPQCSECGSTCD